MDITTPEVKSFMTALYEQTGGDVDGQVSMFELGETLGLDKSSASSLAEELIIEEWVELKTLSGGIGITDKGLEVLQKKPVSAGIDMPKLGSGKVADNRDRDIIGKLLSTVRSGLSDVKAEFVYMESVVIDIKTIEVHLLSPTANIAVLKAALTSLADNLDETGSQTIATTIRAAL